MQLIWVAALAAVVNILLLGAAARFLDASAELGRIILGGSVGAVLTVASLLPGAEFFKTFLWRMLVLLATALTAYGVQKKTAGKALLYSLLHLSLGGVSSAQGDPVSMLLGAAGICLACFAVGGREARIPVELTSNGKTLRLTALRDTGNTLLDPVTGRSVLVVDAQSAKELTGLTVQQLRNPVKTMEQIHGLRLIPYRTVGDSGFLLARMIPQVRIGAWQGSMLVAFSPQEFGSKYQALTGGRS